MIPIEQFSRQHASSKPLHVFSPPFTTRFCRQCLFWIVIKSCNVCIFCNLTELPKCCCRNGLTQSVSPGLSQWDKQRARAVFCFGNEFFWFRFLLSSRLSLPSSNPRRTIAIWRRTSDARSCSSGWTRSTRGSCRRRRRATDSWKWRASTSKTAPWAIHFPSRANWQKVDRGRYNRLFYFQPDRLIWIR